MHGGVTGTARRRLTYVDFKGIAMTIRDYARWQHELDQHELRARSELRNYFALLRKTYAENLRNAIILHELQREDDDSTSMLRWAVI